MTTDGAAAAAVPATKDRAALVVEGGAMRGIFSVGVLDVFMERGFSPFDFVIGASAGACNLASHVAGQDGRNRRAYFDLMTRREFIDVRRALLGRSAVDLDWLWDTLAAREPLDVAAVVGSAVELVIVATSARTGEPVYLPPRTGDLFDALKGSCALPGLYRGQVSVGGEPLIDGGVSDPIPIEEAYRRGARRIVVVRSRPAAFVKTNGWSSRLSAKLARGTPAVTRALLGTAERYQRAVAMATSPPPGCKVLHVAPVRPMRTARTTRDREALEHDYQHGRERGEAAMREWSALA
ncbi:MAG: patatin-like phospholipase family protein [Polyangiaceae bacterium]